MQEHWLVSSGIVNSYPSQIVETLISRNIIGHTQEELVVPHFIAQPSNATNTKSSCLRNRRRQIKTYLHIKATNVIHETFSRLAGYFQNT